MKTKMTVCAAAMAVCVSMLVTACAGQAANVTYTPGTVSGETYTNTVLGIKAEFDSSEWEIADNDYLSNLNDTDISSSDDLTAVMKDEGTVMEFMASMEDGTNVSVGCEDLNRSVGSLMSEERYADASIPGIKEEAKSSGYDLADEDINRSTVTFAGATHTCVDVKVGYSGMDIYEKLIVVKKGQLVYLFTITSLGEEEIAQVASLFEAVGE